MSNEMARQSITLAMQITEKSAAMLATELNAVTNMLQAVAEYDNSAEKLLRYQKEYGKLEYSLCNKEYSKQFEERLRQENILYYKMQNTKNPNYEVFVYPDCYSSRVGDLVKDHMIQNGLVNVISKDEMIRTYKGNGLQSIDGLSKNEISIMRDLLHDRQVTIALAPSVEEGRYKMYFHESNRTEVERALLQEKILTQNKSASYVAEAISFDIGQKQKLYEHIRDNQNDHYYIMSEDHDLMEITKNGFAYRGQDGSYLITKADPQMQEKAYATLSRMQSPVELTRQEFQILKADQKEREKIFKKKIADEKYPDYSMEVAKEMRELERKTSLVEKKISMENPDRQLSEYDLFNDQMNFTSFEMEEDRNMDFEDWKNAMDQKEIDDIHKAFEEYKVENEDINFSQYQILYEQDRKEARVPFFLRDKEERDLIQDYKDEIDTYEFSQNEH